MSIDAMKLALEAFEFIPESGSMLGVQAEAKRIQSITALRQAIEQAQKQEQWGASAVTHPNYIAEQKEKTTVLQEMLEQAQQAKPVAWRFRSGTWLNREVHWRYINTLEGTEGLLGLEPLFISLPQRQWVGLTDEEIDQGLIRTNYAMQTAGAWRDGVEWAQSQLKEKNT